MRRTQDAWIHMHPLQAERPRMYIQVGPPSDVLRHVPANAFPRSEASKPRGPPKALVLSTLSICPSARVVDPLAL